MNDSRRSPVILGLPRRASTGWPPAIAGLFGACILVAAIGAGCKGDHSTDPINLPQYAPQSSPQKCLANLVLAMTSRDSTGYAALFADDFRFFVSPTESDPAIPAEWALADELRAVGRLFRDGSVDRITLSCVIGEPDPAVGVNSDSCRVRVTEVQLEVSIRIDDEWLALRVPGGYGVFHLRKYRDENAGDGGPVWRIERWLDEPIAITAKSGGNVQTATWGSIKARYL